MNPMHIQWRYDEVRWGRRTVWLRTFEINLDVYFKTLLWVFTIWLIFGFWLKNRFETPFQRFLRFCKAHQNYKFVKAFIVLGNVMLVTVIVMVATGILIVSVVIFQVFYFILLTWSSFWYFRVYSAMENCVISKSLQNATANHQKWEETVQKRNHNGQLTGKILYRPQLLTQNPRCFTLRAMYRPRCLC